MFDAPFDLQAQMRITRNRPTLIGNMHWHRHIEINYAIKASITYSVAGQSVDLPSGDIIIFSAMLPHTLTRIEKNSEVFVINLPMELFFTWSLPQSFRTAIFRGDVLRFSAKGLADTERFSLWCADAGSGNDGLFLATLLEVEAMVRRLASKSLSANTDSESEQHNARHLHSERLAQIIDHITQNLRDSSLDVDGIADAVNLNPRYLSTYFRKLTGITLTAYIRRARATVAYAYLTETDKSIGEVAHLSGFGSISQFYEILKRETGLTPARLRKAELPAFMSRQGLRQVLPHRETPCLPIPPIDRRWRIGQ